MVDIELFWHFCVLKLISSSFILLTFDVMGIYTLDC